MGIFRVKGIAAACLLGATVASCGGAGLPGQPDGLYARLATAKGDIVIRLEYEKAPLTVGNFVGLAEGRLDAAKGKKYFDGLTFHRVVPDFVIQSGDPKGDGSGGPGYQFPNEISPALKYDAEGVVGMANAGPNTNGSQFFITFRAVPELDGGYTVFGKVVSGMDVVKNIARGDRLVKVDIVRVGIGAKSFKADQKAWNSREAPLEAAIKKAVEAKRAADLEEIRQRWPGLVAGGDGVLRKTIRASSGAVIKPGQTATVRYKGMLANGQSFDQSDLHGGSVDFQVGVGRIIPGLDGVLLTMRKGEKVLVAIPPELAYGSRGTPGGPIPPDSFLAFEVEVLDIK